MENKTEIAKCECYFEKQFHDYHTTIKNLKAIVKREMEQP